MASDLLKQGKMYLWPPHPSPAAHVHVLFQNKRDEWLSDFVKYYEKMKFKYL